LCLSQFGHSAKGFINVTERTTSGTDAVTSITVKVTTGNIVAQSWVGLYAVDERRLVPSGEVLLTGTATSMAVSSIPQDAGDLVVLSIVRTDAGGVEVDTGALALNSDTTAGNYTFERQLGANASATSASGTSRSLFNATGASATAGQFGVTLLHLPDYANTARHKSMDMLRGTITPTAANCRVDHLVSRWADTSAVTSVAQTPTTGPNFIAGCGMWVYRVPKKLISRTVLSAAAPSIAVNVPSGYATVGLTLSGRSAVAATSDEVEVDFNGSIPPHVIVQDADEYHAWPTIVKASNGNLVAFYADTRGAHGYVATSVAVCRISSDSGQTWGAQATVLDTVGVDDTVSDACLDSAGNILVWTRQRTSDTTYDGWTLRKSTDNGVTWTTQASIVPSPMAVQIFGLIKLANNSLLCGWHGDTPDRAWGVLTSSDSGANWSQVTVESALAEADWPVEQRFVQLANGNILGIARTQTSGNGLFQLQSTDNGANWTKAATNVTDQYQTPTAVIYENPDVHLVYYDRGKGFLRLRSAVALDVWGAPTTWPASTVVGQGSVTSADSGYPAAAQLAAGSYYLVYYSGTPALCAIRGVTLPLPFTASIDRRSQALIGVSTTASAVQDTASVGTISGNSDTAGAVGPLNLSIAQYGNTTSYKHILSASGAGGVSVGAYTAVWETLQSLHSARFTLASGSDFMAGTTLEVWVVDSPNSIRRARVRRSSVIPGLG